jgi:hypothetical protein
MTNDIWSMMNKKKNTLTISAKPTNKVPTASTPATATKAKTTDKTVKVKAVKPKIVKPLVQQTQQPQYQLSDFRLQTTADNLGIHIITTYLGTPIHQFILPVAEYGNWQIANPQIKYNYVQSKTFANAFFGDLRLVQAVIQATVNVIDDLFSRVHQKARM